MSNVEEAKKEIIKQFNKKRIKTIAIVNPRGGVGRTTTVLNLGQGLSLQEDVHNTLLVDLDYNAVLSYAMGLDPHPKYYNIGDVLMGRIGIMTIATETENRIDVAVATEKLRGVDAALLDPVDGVFRLKNALRLVRGLYDVCLIDCPSDMGKLTQNALIASDYVLIPVRPDKPSMRAMKTVLQEVQKVREHYNSEIEVLGVVKFENGSENNEEINYEEYLEEEKTDLIINVNDSSIISLNNWGG